MRAHAGQQASAPQLLVLPPVADAGAKDLQVLWNASSHGRHALHVGTHPLNLHSVLHHYLLERQVGTITTS
jgi:hypothetical protein